MAIISIFTITDIRKRAKEDIVEQLKVLAKLKQATLDEHLKKIGENNKILANNKHVIRALEEYYREGKKAPLKTLSYQNAFDAVRDYQETV